MPLSRQTSRIVWPSKPSTTRPSTSIRMRGDDCGRCGACVSRRRSASDSLSMDGRLAGRVIRSAMMPSRGRTGGHRDRMADAGWAGASNDVLVQLGTEVSHPAAGREGREPLVVAQGRPDDVSRQVLEELDIVRAGTAVDDPIGDLDETPGSDPARDRLAAGLARAEAGQEASEVDDAGPIVGDHDRAGPDVGAGGAERLEVVGRVEELGGKQAAGWAADEHRLDRTACAELAAEGDHVTERRAEGDLRDPISR